jgi:predicted dienelactone hydrolase
MTTIEDKSNQLKKTAKPTSAVLILVVLFVLFMGARAKKPDGEKSANSHPDAATFAVTGPQSIGTRDLVIEGQTPMEIKVWYPASNIDNLKEKIKYPYEIKMGAPFGDVSIASFQGQATREAPFDIPTDPYPLVILSPGFSIGASSYAWLAEHLASYGFVVVSPEHRETLDPGNELWRAAITRPQDILTVFAYLDEQVNPEGSLEGLIDTDLVAVIGHSYGGYTSLAAAGAQIDTDAFQSQCESVSGTDEPGAWLCEQLLPHMADMVSLAGLDSIPDKLWPSWADPRVDAIVPMAGDAFFFGRDGLAEITVPVMAIGGTNDNDSPYLWGTHPSYEYASSPKKVRVAFEGAEHMIFTGPCESTPRLLKFFTDEFCSDSSWDRNYAHSLVKHFTTAFLLSELKQDPAASDALKPASVKFTDVTYESQGY